MDYKLLVDTDNATVAIRSGNVAKHIHPKTDEIQFIVEGSGSMWLGTERKEFKPGTLIVTPKGTAHAGTHRCQRPGKGNCNQDSPPSRGTTSSSSTENFFWSSARPEESSGMGRAILLARRTCFACLSQESVREDVTKPHCTHGN